MEDSKPKSGPKQKTESKNITEVIIGESDFDTKRLYIKATLAITILFIFGILLMLIFFVEIPAAMETLSATMLGGLISTVHAVVSHFFDSTDQEDRSRGKRGAKVK